MNTQILVRGARLHNLKNITVAIPKNQLVVLTGLSGSGKSTLGFDILLNEGIRQYMEALGMIPDKLTKPPVDAIEGLSPTVAIDQRLSNHSPRSTVGTQTDVFSYLRVLFARVGKRPCLNCGKPVASAYLTPENGWDEEPAVDEDTPPEGSFPCPHCGGAVPEMVMANFSFNKVAGACPTCTGLGVVHQANISRLVDEEKSIAGGAILGWDLFYIDFYRLALENAARHYGFTLDYDSPFKTISPQQRDLILYGVDSPQFKRHYPGIEPPENVRKGRIEGIATNLLRRFSDPESKHADEAGYREKLAQSIITATCPDCEGTRLKPESRAVTVGGRTIIELSRLPLVDLAEWLEELPEQLSEDEKLVASAVIRDTIVLIKRLVEAGAGYLTLERASPTLSAGEAQRLRLASLLGSALTGLLYVFDEPTIGLHQRDTHRLIGLLRRLVDLGNTVLVIEHDLEMIASADTLIDFGPGAGRHGGQIVARGTPEEVKANPNSLTGGYLTGRLSIPIPDRRRKPNGKAITIRGASEHNLQGIDVNFPLGLLIAVTGVSGSGKSTLVFDILDRVLRRKLYGAGDLPGKYSSIEGCELIDKVITIDQQHIGRIPRSNAATYTDVFSAIRTVFAATPDAKRLGLTPRHFSFNVPGGRCEHCEGTGMMTVKMQLLPDVEVRCPVCKGRRFTRQVLEVRYREHDISQVLELTVEDALELFRDVPAARSRLQVLSDVGLGYLQLGQPATTLSGGEAQRIKLSKELGRRSAGRTLYLLDEPTTGLHPADTARLLGLLQKLVEAGNTVIVVEHNLELVKAADWIIDLGPEGGAGGGRLLAEGTPEQVAQVEESITGRWLRELV